MSQKWWGHRLLCGLVRPQVAIQALARLCLDVAFTPEARGLARQEGTTDAHGTKQL